MTWNREKRLKFLEKLWEACENIAREQLESFSCQFPNFNSDEFLKSLSNEPESRGLSDAEEYRRLRDHPFEEDSMETLTGVPLDKQRYPGHSLGYLVAAMQYCLNEDGYDSKWAVRAATSPLILPHSHPVRLFCEMNAARKLVDWINVGRPIPEIAKKAAQKSEKEEICPF